MSSARVTSLDALLDWKAALCIFTSEAREALSAVDMEIRRAQVWLDEQMKLWKAEVRRCEDAVFHAKQELARRKNMRIGDRPPDTTDQEKALRLAQARLEYAQEKLEKTRYWQRQLPDDVIDYQGPANQLSGILEGDMPKADAYLENKITSLEAYLQIAPSPPAAAGEGSPPPPSVGRGQSEGEPQEKMTEDVHVGLTPQRSPSPGTEGAP